MESINVTAGRAYRVLASIRLKFTSGNSVPVERAVISSDEWTRLKTEIDEIEITAMLACAEGIEQDLLDMGHDDAAEEVRHKIKCYRADLKALEQDANSDI
ncbi:hypothetical protein A3709_19440 [Halioglobus sp. HI00S01]|uniref:hypothetical protein n=1 Tax=Halioglobus sp. HI00S01 TaxID=1822214 RepID=UPI0007C2BBCE|nr:hypothetical protein [Halioglobus sp. HI00S01]KZX57799.1 hypothetical protein A3709_19440 [Halioglobus sp. HI00S01]